MSYSIEELYPDLSGKTNEELISIQKDLDEQNSKFNSEKIKATKTLHLCISKLRSIDNHLNCVLNEIKRRKDFEDTKNIIKEHIINIEDLVLLSEDELAIITKNMDRTDYRNWGVVVRFHDLDRIVRKVINMKKKYNKWTLSNLSIGGQNDRLPPNTFYNYEYKDEDGNTIKIRQ